MPTRVLQSEFVLGQQSFKRHDDGTEQMNVDGTPGGTPVNVWNGSGDSGADWSIAGSGSETSGSAYGGSNHGWDTGVTSDGNNTTWDNGSMIDVDGTYDTLRFWMQPKAFPATSRPRVVWLDDSNNPVGNNLRIDDYTTNMDLDVWQLVSIPIADFNLTGNSQKLRFRYLNTNGQRYWFDDIEVIPAGGAGPYRFQVAADPGERLHVSMAVLVLSGSASGWDDSKFANISALTNGLLFRQRRISDGEILWRLNSKDNIDLFGRFHPQDDITFANGVLLVGFMVKPGKASVVITDDEVLEWVVRDDLSGLSKARAYVHFGVEEGG